MAVKIAEKIVGNCMMAGTGKKNEVADADVYYDFAHDFYFDYESMIDWGINDYEKNYVDCY